MPDTKPWLTASRALLLLLAYGTLSPRQTPNPTQLVVGVQSDPMGGLVTALHLVVRVGGSVVVDETKTPSRGARVGFPQPWEKTIDAAGASAGAEVDVTVEAMGASGGPPLITRLASTHFVAGRTGLLRLQLELPCVVYPPRPSGSTLPGPLSGPTCTAPFTCIMGACRSDVVPPSGLEPYAANWPTNAPDGCKPLHAGPPILQVGTGQSAYLPMTVGQTLQAEAGPQGGHHIWIATRMRNMKQRLTVTRIEAMQPETHVTIPPSSFVFTYAPDEGQFCRLYGLRYQLDNLGIDYKQFLGKPLDVTVTVTDTVGATAKATAHVQIAPTLVNP